MKAIRVMLDEALLRKLDATDEVKRDGRSAVVRRALAEYLVHRQAGEIAERYAQAYTSDDGLGAEFDGWEEQGTWPPE